MVFFSLNELGKAAFTNGDALQKLSWKVADATTAEQNASSSTWNLGNELDGLHKQTVATGEQLLGAQEWFKDFGGSLLAPTINAKDFYGTLESGTNSAENQSDALAKLKAAIAAVSVETQKSINSNIGGFDKVGKTHTQSAKSTLAALKTQADYLAKYKENYEKAKENGVSSDVLAQLNDGSKESAEVLAGLAKANATQIADINAMYTAVTTQSAGLATTLATDQATLDAANAAAQALADKNSQQTATTATTTADTLTEQSQKGETAATSMATSATTATTAESTISTSVTNIGKTLDGAKTTFHDKAVAIYRAVVSGLTRRWRRNQRGI